MYAPSISPWTMLKSEIVSDPPQEVPQFAVGLAVPTCTAISAALADVAGSRAASESTSATGPTRPSSLGMDHRSSPTRHQAQSTARVLSLRDRGTTAHTPL